jgi:hypothetical protein
MPDRGRGRRTAAARRWRIGGPEGRTIHAQTGAEPSDSDPLVGMMDSRELAEAAVEGHNRMPAVDPAERRWNDAVDWLLNSRHCGDPDIQDMFWGIAEGMCTRQEAETINLQIVRRRAARAEKDSA